MESNSLQPITTNPGVRVYPMGNPARIQVFTVDDHPLLREGIAAVIASQRDMILVGQAATGSQAIRQYQELQPDVTLMNLRLPDMSGIDAMMAIREEFPYACILILSAFEGDVEIRRALDAGARGFLLKTMPPDDLVEGIRQVHAGRKLISSEIAFQLAEHMGRQPLTDREVEVLRLVAGGNRNQKIAEKLFITEATVKVHVRHIMKKLRASDRTHAVAIGIRRGIIQL